MVALSRVTTIEIGKIKAVEFWKHFEIKPTPFEENGFSLHPLVNMIK